ncbi:decapping and exoribonuclease protein [Pseudomyrmex gracilis]|uniref:decapping and exoribonuclease protein n=1 Tax=Pseudomyrmex gracilis TaxID=219809 RepID=UPI0009951659|nr:decapping and exoribonuclease protein [Pseudomyrmex gracilis]
MFRIELDKCFEIPQLQIELIGHYSIDGNSKYRGDLSQLKYYVPPLDFNNVNYDLNENIASTKYKPNSYVKLDDVCKWILNNFTRVERLMSTEKDRWLNVDFVCRRGAFTTILSSPYVQYDCDWIICASKYRGTIYLCKFYTDAQERNHGNSMDKRGEAWGFKFEQYMVADHPSHQPDTSKPVNASEAFHCVFQANYGDHSLLYEAEIDGIVSQDYITDTLVGKQFEIIELKTIGFRQIEQLSAKFTPKKISDMWNQNSLAGVRRSIFGLREGKSSIVKSIQECSTDDLLNLSFAHFNVNHCKAFCKLFLDNVKKIVTKDHNECMYKFYRDTRNKNTIYYSEEAPDNDKYIFLKPQFIHEADKYK